MSTPDSRITASLRTAQAAAATVALVGASVLLGWAFGIASLKHVVPGLVSMVPNTALCLCLLGAVVFQQAGAPARPTLPAASQAVALLVAVVSGLTLLQYLTHKDFGIDQFLFLDDTRVMPAEYPGRMAPVTTLCLLFSSLALLLGRWPHMACVLAVLVLFFGILAVTGYAFGVSSLYQVIGYTSVALHTAVALVLLSVAMLASRPRQGMLPIILMFVILYFLMIRPQMKRQKEHRAMIDAIAKGDEVATSGGIIGKVTRLSEGFLHIEIASNVEVQIQRSAVVQVLPKGTVK